MSAPYITPEGYASLEAEVEQLWRRRRHVTAALAAAAAEGDRSENAEYIYRKKELRELDRRIRYLQKRLPELKVVREVASLDQVFFGAWVRLEREGGDEVCYRIVGPDETNASKGFISIDSPLARALMKKRRDDEIVLQLGGASENFLLLNISYEGPPTPSDKLQG